MADLNPRQHGMARPPIEPLVPPHRPPGAATRRVGMTMDHERYVRFRTFAAEHGLSGDDLAVIAVDRLITGR